VMTLNIAHGRKDGAHQMFQKAERIRANLDDIAAVLRRERPDIVALQEADGPSAWSGGFDHVDHLSRAAELPFIAHGKHVDGMGLHYGTALASIHPLRSRLSATFKPSPPTFSKGFVAATMPWPGGGWVDIVSVHLDFSRASVRAAQMAEMRDKLAGRFPLIVMGDFNGGFKEGEAARALAESLNLAAFQPERTDLATFPSNDTRIDWILISPELEFVSCRVLPDILSDHRAVIAEIRLKKGR
jgi:endonuclease/exonuclease/phosphatase family metal-dependent hydrolase